MANRPGIKIAKVAQLKGHKDSIYDFVLDKETRTIYSAGAEGYVVKWDIDNPENGILVLQGGEAFYSMTKHDAHLLLGSRNGEIFKVNLADNTLVSKQKKHHGGVFFIMDTTSGGEDGILSYTRNEEQRSLQVSNESLRCIIQSEGSYFIGASDHLIYEVDKDTMQVTRTLVGHTNSVFALTLLDEKTLVSTGRDAMIRAWDLTIGKEVYSVAAHEYQAKSVSYNGNILISSSMDKTIKLWNDKLELVKVIDFDRYQGHTNCINKVEWIDENMFVSCSDDRTLCLWKVEIIL
jgi:WD repeat-containing protein 61